MTRNTNARGAPRCIFCGNAGAGVQFAIFAPRFQPFGTACVECEKNEPETTRIVNGEIVRPARMAIAIEPFTGGFAATFRCDTTNGPDGERVIASDDPSDWIDGGTWEARTEADAIALVRDAYGPAIDSAEIVRRPNR